METLETFIQSNPRPQELKRALAVQMSEKGYSYRQIQDVLQMSLGFISSSNQRYEAQGVAGLRVKYWGTQGYLSSEDKAQVLLWLSQKRFGPLKK